MRKAHTRDSLQALSKLGEMVDGKYRIVSQPPVVVPLREIAAQYRHVARTRSRKRCGRCSGSIAPPWRWTAGTCWRSSRSIDVARKVVGVGSVGTRAFIVLLQGRDENDPLFLQVKEATSVGAGGPPAESPSSRTRASGWSAANG